MTIDRVGGGAAPQTSFDTSGLQQTLAGGKPIDSARLLNDLLASLVVMQGAAAKGPAEPRTGPPGAPALEMPAEDFSADQLALILSALNNKSSEAQIKTAKEGLEISKTQKDEMHKKAIEKIEEAARKAAEAASKNKVGGIFGWIGKIAAFVAAVVATVAAVVATVATGGAAAPLLALAVMGLVATGMDLANHISQNMDPPGPEISISKFMTDFAAVILTDVCGMSKEDAKKFAPILACVMATMVSPGAAAILAPDLYGNAAAAIAVAAGMNPDDAKWLAMAVTLAVTITVAVVMVVATGGMGALDGVAKTAAMAGRIAQTAGQAMSGVTNIAQGAIKIDAAHSQKEADLASASKKEFDKMLMVLAKQMEDEQERIKELLQNLDQAMTMVSQMIASAGETRLQQVKNIV